MEHIIGERYQIQQELGAGGMGTVYRGYDVQTRTTVAVKKLKSQLASPELIERFQREGEALRALKHPNIVQLLDTVEEDGQHYLVMEYVTGGDLSQKLEKGVLPIKDLLLLAIDLCDALTRAHKLDIIHRDLKPANILIAEDGTVRLTDFGVAHFGNKQRMTNADSVIGTIDYLAPEVFEQSQIDKRADIWAFGVILFEMLTGQRPFASDSMTETLNKIVKGNIPDIEELRYDAPMGLVDLTYRILTRNPDERIPSIRLVGAELEALLSDTPTATTIKQDVAQQAMTSAFDTTPITESKHNLPRPSTPFVGRENELSTLASLLRDPKIQLVSIIAQGGMGKTRLSIEVAKAQLANFPDGVYFIELAPLSSADDIPRIIADTIGYALQKDKALEQTASYFREKNCLLIFDNFEHLLAGRDLVQAILQASRTKILITTRERLNLSAENLFHLEGLDVAEWQTPDEALKYASMRLFMESAKRVRGDFVLDTADLPYASRICQLVHGLPLGLVLSASWLDALSLKEISEEIASNIDFLETTMYDIPERQWSLRAVFDYSWKMLSEGEQQAFACLAVFRGGMSREAAQAISEANIRILQMLVNKSLVRRDSTTGRYEIHELLRQYGDEFLAKNGVAQLIRQRHMTYYAQFMASRGIEITGKRQLPALAEIDVDFENVKSAWRYACELKDEQVITQMLDSVYWYCNFRHRALEGFELFSLGREVWQGDSLLATRLLIRYPTVTTDYTATYEKGLELAKKTQDQHEIAFALRQLGLWLSHNMSDHHGITLMEESSRIFEKLDEPFCQAFVLDDLGWSYRITGNSDAQLASVQRSVDLRRAIGDKIGMANSLRNMGGALGGFGGGSAEPLYKWLESLQLSREIGDKRNIAWNCYMVGVYWQYDGELDKAIPYCQEALEIASEIKEETVYGLCLLSQALDIILRDGDYNQARALIDKGYPPNSPFDLRMIVSITTKVYLVCVSQNSADMKQMIGGVYQFSKNFNNQFVGLTILLGAQILIKDAQYERAVEWLGAYEQTPFHRVTRIWGWYEQYWARIITTMGQASFDSAYKRGALRGFSETVEDVMRYIEKLESAT